MPNARKKPYNFGVFFCYARVLDTKFLVSVMRNNGLGGLKVYTTYANGFVFWWNIGLNVIHGEKFKNNRSNK